MNFWSYLAHDNGQGGCALFLIVLCICITVVILFGGDTLIEFYKIMNEG